MSLLKKSILISLLLPLSFLNAKIGNCWDSETGAGVVSSNQSIVRTSLEATEVLQSDARSNLYGTTIIGGASNYASFDSGGIFSIRNVVSSRDAVLLANDQYAQWRTTKQPLASDALVRVGVSTDDYLILGASVYATQTIKTTMAGNKCVQTNASGVLMAADDTCGVGTPGGSDTQIQYNNSGAFGGDADFTWVASTNVATINGDLYFSESTDTTKVIQVQDQGTANTAGNTLTILGSDANGLGNGGDITIAAGNGVGARVGGSVNFTAGDGNSGGGSFTAVGGIATTGSGGSFVFSGGSSDSGNGGAFVFTGGSSTSANGGNMIITGGTSSGGIGGLISIAAGTSTNQRGSDISITASSGNGSHQRGGDITLSPGSNTDTGRSGRILLSAGSQFTSNASENNTLITHSSVKVSSNATMPLNRGTIFLRPDVSGVAGGGTETLTSNVTVFIAGGGTTRNATITENYALVVDSNTSRFRGNVEVMGAVFSQDSAIIASDATTFSASTANLFTTSCNTVPTAITGITGTSKNQLIYISGGCDTNGTSINDAAPFKLSADIRLSIDDTIVLRVSGDATFVEVNRANN